MGTVKFCILIILLVFLGLFVFKTVIITNRTSPGSRGVPADWKMYKSETLKVSFYYPQSITVIEEGDNIKLDFGMGTPARAGIFLGKNYRGEPSKEWYLQNHPEISIEDKKNSRFSEYKAFGFEGTLVSYVGSNYGFDTNLLIPHLGKLYIVSTNSLGSEFFSSIQFYN